MPMIGYKLGTSGVGSSSSTNCVTTTADQILSLLTALKTCPDVTLLKKDNEIDHFPSK